MLIETLYLSTDQASFESQLDNFMLKKLRWRDDWPYPTLDQVQTSGRARRYPIRCGGELVLFIDTLPINQGELQVDIHPTHGYAKFFCIAFYSWLREHYQAKIFDENRKQKTEIPDDYVYDNMIFGFDYRAIDKNIALFENGFPSPEERQQDSQPGMAKPKPSDPDKHPYIYKIWENIDPIFRNQWETFTDDERNEWELLVRLSANKIPDWKIGHQINLGVDAVKKRRERLGISSKKKLRELIT